MKRLGGFWLLTALVVLLPIIFPDNYYVTVVAVAAGLHAILAVGLNLLMGYAGGLRRSEIVSLDVGRDDTPGAGGWIG